MDITYAMTNHGPYDASSNLDRAARCRRLVDREYRFQGAEAVCIADRWVGHFGARFDSGIDERRISTGFLRAWPRLHFARMRALGGIPCERFVFHRLQVQPAA